MQPAGMIGRKQRTDIDRKGEVHLVQYTFDQIVLRKCHSDVYVSISIVSFFLLPNIDLFIFLFSLCTQVVDSFSS